MSTQSTSNSPMVRGTDNNTDPHIEFGSHHISKPNLTRVNTNLQNYTVTPASAHSISSIAPSPSSIQCSPAYNNIQRAEALPIDHLNLGEPAYRLDPHNPNTSPLTRGEPRPEGLTRKLSSKAKSGYETLRRKASSGNQRSRDASVGPVSRRRSDSKTSTANTFYSEAEDPVPALPDAFGVHRMNSSRDVDGLPDLLTSDSKAEVKGPRLPDALVAGSLLIKASRKKRQEQFFFLDRDGSKVTWQGTVGRKTFFIDNVRSIRWGIDAVSSWKDTIGDDVNPDCCFTINYAPSQSSNNTKTLHLLAHNKAQRALWVKTLEALSKHREELMTEMNGSDRIDVLRAHWNNEIRKLQTRENKDTQQGLDIFSVYKLCRKLQIHCPKSVVEARFKAADARGIGYLDFDQFRSFIDHLRIRVDIQPIFNSRKVHGIEGINKETFFAFLEQEQGVDLSHESVQKFWQDRFSSLARASSCATPEASRGQYIDFARFSLFLSRDCHVYSSPMPQTMKLDRPLNEYFISSSHNTYLIGRQVNGISSVEPYVTALRRGCRSVEIDCWDGDNGEPRVTHGFTHTSSIPFCDVVHAINRCAFDASPYPVILSLEVHCNPRQQQRMVQIMKEGFGERLLLLLLPNHMGDLPSPEELVRKILVKVKATDPRPDVSMTSDSSAMSRACSSHSQTRRPAISHQSSSFQSTPGNAFPTVPTLSEVSTDLSPSLTSGSEEEIDEDEQSPISSDRPSVRVKTSKIHSDLANLGVYLQGYSYRTPADLKFMKFNHIFSINENTAIDIARHPEHKGLLEQHNTDYMCRVYPKTSRVLSSNFDPNTFWRRGVQMVALNWQTYDIHMQMHQAMFAAGMDATGYVPKPSYLTQPRPRTNFFNQKIKLPQHKITFSVRVISAQRLPLLSTMSKTELISPFIQIEMFSAEDKARGIASGAGGEEVSSNDYHGIGVPYSRRTKVVPHNGYNPQFNEQFTLTVTTKYPELVFVRFIVFQRVGKSSKELAIFTAKLQSLQAGYRHLPLYNSNGEELIFSTLFCHIKKEKPEITPASFEDVLRAPLRQRGKTLRSFFSSERNTVEDQRRAAQPELNQEIRDRGV